MRTLGWICTYSTLRLNIVHSESLERLLVDSLKRTGVKNLKSLQYLYYISASLVDSELLSDLGQLKEIHVHFSEDVPKLFKQKRRFGRGDLKIYLRGLLLNGPDEPARSVLQNSRPGHLTSEVFGCLVENQSRLADVIPFYTHFDYPGIERAARGLEVDLLRRFADLREIRVNSPFSDEQRFLEILESLFDPLPEHSAIQKLVIWSYKPSDQSFLFRLKHLIHLKLGWSIDTQFVRS